VLTSNLIQSSRSNEAARPAPEPRRAAVDRLSVTVEAGRRAPGDWPATCSVPVSVLVPVRNEAVNIVECLRRLDWASERVVVDSQSQDDTVALSQAMGAEVYQFHISAEGWPKKRNWALAEIPWANEWVLIMDADEHMTPELAAEIEAVVRGVYRPSDPRRSGCGDGYWLNRRLIFMNRWIRGCGYYPSWNIRLFKHRVGRYERIGQLGHTQSGDNEVHEHVVLSTGKAGYLEHDFLHYAYPDLTSWVEKHNRYTSWEAHVMLAGGEGGMKGRLLGSPIERRRWLKNLAKKLPFRPTLRFIYGYFLKRGCLDGYPGYVICRLMAWYEFMSIAKMRELKIKAGAAGRSSVGMRSNFPPRSRS
jgi:glycosyltransferase involved in cell wall biosynthesis